MPTLFDAETDPDWLAARDACQAMPEGPRRAFTEKRLELKRSLSPIKMTLIAHIAVAGNLVFITMPCDTCSALGLDIKRAFPRPRGRHHRIRNTYCNYLVPKEDYGKYFETFNARTARGQPMSSCAASSPRQPPCSSIEPGRSCGRRATRARPSHLIDPSIRSDRKGSPMQIIPP